MTAIIVSIIIGLLFLIVLYLYDILKVIKQSRNVLIEVSKLLSNMYVVLKQDERLLEDED